MTDWGHDELLADLKGHIEKTGVNGSRMVWTDIPMGPSGSMRPDLFSLEKSFSKPNPTVYEIKISKSDFRADVTTGKWTGYQQFSSRVIFCVPKGLVTKEEVPSEAGLMVRSENGWRNIKKATVTGKKPGFDHMLKLLMNLDEKTRIKKREIDLDYHSVARKIKKRHGDKIGEIVANIGLAEYKIQEAEKRAKQIIFQAEQIQEREKRYAEDEKKRLMEDYEQLLTETKEALSLPESLNRFEVLGYMRQIRNTINGVSSQKIRMLKRLSNQAEQMRMSIDEVVREIEDLEKLELEIEVNQATTSP